MSHRSRKLLVGICSVSAVAWAGVQSAPFLAPLITGKWITPEGRQAEVGSFPANMALSPDRKYVAVTNTGYRQQITILDADTGVVVDRYSSNAGTGRNKESLYFGISFAKSGSQTLLYASRGQQDRISVLSLGANRKLSFVKDIANPAPAGSLFPHHVAGVALNSDGSTLYAVNNQTHQGNGLRGSLSLLNTASGELKGKVNLAGFPLDVVAITEGPNQDRRVFVTSERDDLVSVVNPETARVESEIKVGAIPAYLKLSPDQSRLYVANSGSDTVSVIDTGTLAVRQTYLLRPAAFRGIPGSTPLGMDLSPDGKRLFVAMADLNAVAVVDTVKGELAGYLPAGWYPTSVAVCADGDRLLVANAKGVQVRNPNGTPVRSGPQNQYGANIIEGTVSNLDLSQALGRLDEHTHQVLANNRANEGETERVQQLFRNPGIKHVVYIVKENRTYDQVLGDLDRGNGDPSLVLFPREVTPNQHALAERFALLDNFYVCAEVSADGWNWSTSGMANEYTQRNTFTNYSGRGRQYDFEGTNNGISPSLQGLRDVAAAEGGYIWDAALAAGRTVRNYGMFSAFDANTARPESREMVGDGAATKLGLGKVTSPDFRRYDLSFADSEAWVAHNLKSAPRQMKEYGPQKDASRMTSWKREFAEMVRQKSMPNLMLVRLGRDHTAGTTPGQYSPKACVADNDYAVGQLVEAISRSPFWKETAIFVVEDDAQAGFDHVDSHRSTAFVISPYVQRGTLDSTFYNTDSVLRTMTMILGAKPMNQYVAVATPFGFLGKRPTNAAPYEAILPAKSIIADVNSPSAYRAKDSLRLINNFQEESIPDIALNDILWGDIQGARAPRPTTPNARWRTDNDR